MAQRPELAKNEVEVARIVWELRDATVRQVLERLSEHRTIDFSSVQTWLRRLEEKGYLKVRLEGRTRVYSARVKPRTVIRETVDDLVKRLFSGETMPLMQHLIEDRGDISADQITQLRGLLDQLENNGQSKKGAK